MSKTPVDFCLELAQPVSLYDYDDCWYNHWGIPMDKIRPWLYIGKYSDTLNMHLLSRHNIKAMLQLAELVEHPGITSLYLDVEDGEPLPHNLLRTGIEFELTE